MSKTQGVVRLSAVVMLALASFGCGSKNSNANSNANSALPGGSVVAATTNPLVAQYTITHSHPGLSAWVEFGTDTTYGRQTSAMNNSIPAGSALSLSILVAGMMPQTTYHMRAHAQWTGGDWADDDHTFTTGAVPASPGMPSILVDPPASASAPAPGIELLSLISEPVATDLQGNTIWYCPINAYLVKPMQNGHFILLSGGSAGDLFEVDLACNIIREVSLFQVNQSLQAQGHSYNFLGFSHDVLTQPNGDWITIVSIGQDFTDLPGYPGTTGVVGDLLVDIDPTGKVVWSWSAFDHLDITRYPYFGLPDWTHSNALVYTQDHNLLLSIRHQAWIIKIDYADGKGAGDVLWRLGQDGDFTLLGGDPSQWFYAQHDPNILSTNGSQVTLAVFDNGNFRIDPSTGLYCGSSGAPACYSRATIFEIDESTNIATLLWQHLPGFFSSWGGSIGVLSSGNMEFDSSAPGTQNWSEIREVTQTDNPETVWKMTITGTGTNAYRGQRIPSLYPGVTWQK